MIDRTVVLDCAERAGFGGVSRNQLYPRLSAFATLIAQWNTQQNAAACEQIGHRYREKETEFADGQMDGAYQCAEYLTKRL